MLKFGFKLGLATGAMYYLSNQGVWGSNNDTQKVIQNICTTVDPYIQDLKTKLPFEIPDLPSTNRVSYVTKQCWNEGVMVTFNYLKDFPQHLEEWTNRGKEAILQNNQIKQYLDSLSNSQDKK